VPASPGPAIEFLEARGCLRPDVGVTPTRPGSGRVRTVYQMRAESLELATFAKID
jgi:hypothetical protein